MKPRTVAPRSDAALVREIEAGGAGATEAERELCARLLPRVRVYLARYQVDPYTVEDASHDVLICVLEGLRAGRLEDPARVGAYALGICRNKSNERMRRDQRRHRALLRVAEDEYAQMPAPRLQIGRLEECLHFLREHDRTLLRLSFCEGRSARAAGEALGLTAQAVRVRRHRVIDKLRQCLGVGRYEAQR